MTLFEAPKYDPKRDRRRLIAIWSAVVVVIVLAVLVWMNRHWPEEHLVKKFFVALENKDFDQAYGLWIADANWKQRPPAPHSRYSFNDFYQDWGPGGEWGVIRSHHIDGSLSPGSTGVVVVVTVNERKEQARIWVEKKDKSFTFSPY